MLKAKILIQPSRTDIQPYVVKIN